MPLDLASLGKTISSSGKTSFQGTKALKATASNPHMPFITQQSNFEGSSWNMLNFTELIGNLIYIYIWNWGTIRKISELNWPNLLLGSCRKQIWETNRMLICPSQIGSYLLRCPFMMRGGMLTFLNCIGICGNSPTLESQRPGKLPSTSLRRNSRKNLVSIHFFDDRLLKHMWHVASSLFMVTSHMTHRLPRSSLQNLQRNSLAWVGNCVKFGWGRVCPNLWYNDPK